MVGTARTHVPAALERVPARRGRVNVRRARARSYVVECAEHDVLADAQRSVGVLALVAGRPGAANRIEPRACIAAVRLALVCDGRRRHRGRADTGMGKGTGGGGAARGFLCAARDCVGTCWCYHRARTHLLMLRRRVANDAAAVNSILLRPCPSRVRCVQPTGTPS